MSPLMIKLQSLTHFQFLTAVSQHLCRCNRGLIFVRSIEAILNLVANDFLFF